MGPAAGADGSLKFIPGLNGLRALSVICVVIFHWGCPFLSDFILKHFFPAGNLGVDVFFVVSGFLISSILFIGRKKLSGAQTAGGLIRRFYIRRFLRIFPLYYLLIAFIFLFGIPKFNNNVVWYLTYTENFNMFFHGDNDFFMHAWSLSVEEQFYLIWPFVLIFTPQKHVLKVLFFFILLGPASSFAQTHIFKSNYAFYILTPECFEAFGIGALLAYCYTENKMRNLKRVVKILLPFAFLAFYYSNVLVGRGDLQFMRRLADSILASGAILFCLSKKNEKIRGLLLENKALVQIGIVSYGIYLFHYILPWFYLKTKMALGFGSGTLGSGLDYGMMVILLLLISFASYYLLEKPILSLKSRFR